jgi:adenosylcobinamide-phosphate synthase
MALGLILPHWPDVLAPSALALLAAVIIDAALGDPVYRLHPIRLMGKALSWLEEALRAAGAGGYGGGILLFVLLAALSVAVATALLLGADAIGPRVGQVVHVFLLYSLLALGDLLRHVWRIEAAIRRGDLPAARTAVGWLVGRDTDRLDEAACRRAAVESLSESLTDGFVSPLFWYVLAGIPGIVVFKVVSTMDSMVGYKTPRYIRFGWCGARLDDVMNYVPARLTWLLIGVLAAILPGYSGRKAWRVGLGQHAVLPGPNSGWSEAATAGALERRIVGPIWRNGTLVTDVWIGEPADPPLATAADMTRAAAFVSLTGACIAALGWAVLHAAR